MKRKTWLAAGAAVLVAAAATGGAVGMSSAKHPTAAAQETANTVKVERGNLSSVISLFGTLTYRARSDGSPYPVINQAHGTYTALPEEGDSIACGDVLYRVDDEPVLLLCGTVPAYRDLHAGDAGNDVRQLNANLQDLGADADPTDDVFTSKTETALEQLQRDKGQDVTGALALGDAVFLPGPVRIAKVAGEAGGSAPPGAAVLYATSTTLEVRVNLDPSQQGDVKEGEAARITLPGHRTVTGKVDRLGKVAQLPAPQGTGGQNADAGAAIIPAYVSLDDPQDPGGLDQAPVQVDITTTGVQNVLSVPVTALVGKAGGGFAVEVVRDGARHEVVAVQLGLFDTAGGRVQVDGDLREGDDVVVPAS